MRSAIYWRNLDYCQFGVEDVQGFLEADGQSCLSACLAILLRLQQLPYGRQQRFNAVAASVVAGSSIFRLIFVEIFCFDVLLPSSLTHHENW